MRINGKLWHREISSGAKSGDRSEERERDIKV